MCLLRNHALFAGICAEEVDAIRGPVLVYLRRVQSHNSSERLVHPFREKGYPSPKQNAANVFIVSCRRGLSSLCHQCLRIAKKHQSSYVKFNILEKNGEVIRRKLLMFDLLMFGYPRLRQVWGDYSEQAICFRDPL